MHRNTGKQNCRGLYFGPKTIFILAFLVKIIYFPLLQHVFFSPFMPFLLYFFPICIILPFYFPCVFFLSSFFLKFSPLSLPIFIFPQIISADIPLPQGDKGIFQYIDPCKIEKMIKYEILTHFCFFLYPIIDCTVIY
jgi:hypothetical protein